MIVVIIQMKRIVTMLVGSTSSSARRPENVFWMLGSVMETPIAVTARTKILPFAITELVIPPRNIHARMVVAFLNFGTVISIMTVGTTLTSPHTSVATEIALLVGDVVRLGDTTDVFQTGCSVMENRTVGMALMSDLKTVPNAIQIKSSLAVTDVAYLIVGSAISKMTVEITLMSPLMFAKPIESVRNPNSNVELENVYLCVGDAIMTMTAGTVQTNRTARTSHVQRHTSSALLATVLQLISNVMEIGTVTIYPMSLIVHLAILMANTVRRRNLSAIIICVSATVTFAMALMTVLMALMRRPNSAETSHATNCIDSSAATTNAYQGIRFAMVETTVVMALTKIM